MTVWRSKMPKFKTPGEALAGRLLKQERRQGVPHYVPGQMAAEAHMVIWVSFVNKMGHVIAIPFVRNQDGELEDIGTYLQAGMATQSSKPLPEGYEPSKKMLSHIRRAERKAKG